MTSIEESTAKIRFELATFCFFKNEKNVGIRNWACGLKINAPPEHEAYAADHVRTKFQDEFFQIAENNFLPNSVLKDNHRPHLYMINSVILMCAELAGDFHLGDSRQLTDKSLLPFDLVS
ncbi:hypothetical protein [Acinetobacter haemolyticus]|uniref:hypothetical protein n=1 Tax=Acinetobacter haemolyticus TaxID=29430 RepID=UPI0013835311|nr:hypothetical protein [Acinetobacter haemolyticus]NAR71884.1 hypothetical protein [Acinetobacter haemolyticus]